MLELDYNPELDAVVSGETYQRCLAATRDGRAPTIWQGEKDGHLTSNSLLEVRWVKTNNRR
jgi:hypothetical protein